MFRITVQGNLDEAIKARTEVVVMLLRFANGAIGEVHVNAFQKNASHYVEFIGQEGTITCDLLERKVGLYRSDTESWEYFREYHQHDDAFLQQAEDFIGAIQGMEAIAATFEEAARTLKVCVMARESCDSGQVMKVQ